MSFTTTIRGHECQVLTLAKRDAGTYDVEVLSCATCSGLVGQCFRISGMSGFAERFAAR